MDRISFSVNGVKCHVGGEVRSDVTLLDYVRKHLELRGTKYMCLEGGCGACIVSVVRSPGEDPISVNSCLVSITSCSNWEITTIEKVGNRLDGYHPIQKTMAENNATQCGYCTPGWVMAMFSLLKSKEDLTMLEIEKSLGSNICRCTGYRPILDALKKFAKDSPKAVKVPDIEDLHKCKQNCSNCIKCSDEDDWCVLNEADLPNILEIDLKDGKKWYRVSTVGDIFDVFEKRGVDSYMLVAGNTAKGANPIDEYPPTMIDISGISELKGSQQDQNLIIYAGNTLSQMLEILLKTSDDHDFKYLKTIYDHIELVAHIPVRNIGTIAGNLMMKHENNGSTSDIFLLFTTVNAELTIRNRAGSKRVSMEEFLKTDMKGYVIVSVLLPPLNDEYKLVTYKTMPRAQNAHAIVNAGFLYRLQQDNTVRQCRIIFSGLKPPFTQATVTEKYLTGKELFTNETLQAAVKILDQEIEAVENLPEPSAKYRKQLALGLFYKGLLSLCPNETLHARYRSGGANIHSTRGVTKGQQDFQTDTSLWPLNKPTPRTEALIQCAGEVPYTEDLPSFPREVFSAFVLATEPTGIISNIEPSEALKQQGVIAFYTAKDIPGINSFVPEDFTLLFSNNEEVLCSGVVKYFNQPIGILVAESRSIAERAAKLVKVTYKNVKKPVIDFQKAKEDPSRVTEFFSKDATRRGNDVAKVIKGGKTVFHQYHFPMETMVCVTRPVEDGFAVHSATHWIDQIQLMISRALKIDENSVDVYSRRVGGSFGIKLSRASQVAVASALVTSKLNRPCRFIQAITTNMRAVGKRYPAGIEFEVSVNKSGVIQRAKYLFSIDDGYIVNEDITPTIILNYSNIYENARWNFKGYHVVTDTHKNTACRAPGTLESISLVEFMFEQIAYELSLDPIEVRMANIDDDAKEVKEMLETLKTKSDYKTRRTAVDKFNSENRWRKRGLRTSFMKFGAFAGLIMNAILSVNHGDGTVSITHSGIELGQGMNTKSIQTAAFCLDIPAEKIKIKATNSIVGPNAYFTGGSITTQNVGIAIQRACEELLKRLTPVKKQMPDDASWEDIVSKAYDLTINLQTLGYASPFVGITNPYNIYGVCFAEVEVDILTGESEVLRVDILEDVGRSINPELDVGQIEGAFMMGMGYWTCENVVFNPENGEILTDRTWNYNVPQARDIPQDLRIHLKENSFSKDVYLGSKAVSEPPICLAVAVPLAFQEAISSARLEAGNTVWASIDGPYTVEKICLASAINIKDFKFN